MTVVQQCKRVYLISFETNSDINFCSRRQKSLFKMLKWGRNHPNLVQESKQKSLLLHHSNFNLIHTLILHNGNFCSPLPQEGNSPFHLKGARSSWSGLHICPMNQERMRCILFHGREWPMGVGLWSKA